MAAWRSHFASWPPASVSGIVAVWVTAHSAGQSELADHVARRFPGAFEYYGIASEAAKS